ncbi:MAG: polyprenyl synthetase family protein [Patescibacteria group bacterium]|nr:polyprenyl synthetase family protein [Patescibacteria group bacterium]
MKQPISPTAVSRSQPRTFASVREDVDVVLQAHYKSQSDRANVLSPDFSFLWDAASHQNKAGGKRLRPYLCMLAYESLGGTEYHDVLPVAAALELLHSAMLIHDDIIDRDYVRRNEPNVAGIYQIKYATALQNSEERDHFANAAALLAGDLLLSDAYQLILMSTIQDTAKIKMSKLLGDAIYTVVAGELLDSEAALYPLERADSLNIAELKTAQYSFATPLLAGSIMANAPEADQAKLREFGTKLGIAFQLADDLLGVFGDESETGKSALSDIREGKCTYLLQQSIRMATAEQKQHLLAIVGNPLCDKTMAEQARAIFTETGAKAEVERLMTRYANDAETILKSLNLSDAYHQKFVDFIQQAVWRKR